jgi:hypothetical protein
VLDIGDALAFLALALFVEDVAVGHRLLGAAMSASALTSAT